MAWALATFASSFVVAMPTVIGSPTCSCTAARSRVAISSGLPEISCSPRTSRNASSIDTRSTTGAVSSKIATTARLASTYASKRGDTTIACGHSRRARPPPIADLMPNARAS